MPVTERLGDRDHIGHDALLLKAPEPGAQPTEPDLHFVRDRHTAGAAHLGVHRFQVAGGQVTPPALP